MKTRIIFLLVLAIVGVYVSFKIKTSNDNKKILPVYNPVDMREEMVDSSIQRVGYGHTIGNFSFLNQDGKTITNKDLKGKVFVAVYFFTTCGNICPRMNKQMQRVQKKFANNPKLNKNRQSITITIPSPV